MAITELVFIIDRSGSMSGLEKCVIKGFNSMLEQQQKDETPCYINTMLFDDKRELVHDRDLLRQTPMLTDDIYYVRGCTALIDAIGEAVNHISMIHKYIRPEDVPANTLFVIITDGMENASRYYTVSKVRGMISERRKRGWQFLFLGIEDAEEVADDLGIREDYATEYNCDAKGLEIVYNCISKAITEVRNGRKITAEWKTEIQKDFEERGKKA